ncbi:hypothetical protein KFL_002320090 [Klebsormidium nitens]|uniref:RING-type domain-containing protein n=1 Tax=Klebsormidium nitens TaxID=105231 RepID=A0A1Y1I365_KLENI|nr:hypothetical protein KFL_002320090 [Klebsormidium nitens]|eukprot:GAQ85375.1 hypothetical protein KFL_002320090 [Klebsormidium nitens]
MDPGPAQEAMDAAETGHRSSPRHWPPANSLSSAFLSGWRQGQAPVSNMLFRWMHTRTMPTQEESRAGHDQAGAGTSQGLAEGDVAIEIGEREVDAQTTPVSAVRQSETPTHGAPHAASSPLLTPQRLGRLNSSGSVVELSQPASARSSRADDRDGGESMGGGGAGRDAGPARYDLQQAARWLEQALPFILLLIMVFIREHMQGFLMVVWITGLMMKANEIIRRETALKTEKRSLLLLGLAAVLALHIAAVYWWYRNDELWRPLALLPLLKIPGFWQAAWIIVVNDTLVRYFAMIIKACLLAGQKHARGRPFRKQAQLLTLVEYTSLLYRALIPAPVWYRFFLNETYGHLFSSLTTGLYLTFKLTATFDKVCSFISAARTVARREVQYGQVATSEEVLAAGDLCAICQEKMQSPISLRCHHVFCEDCVAEWFERERTCPLCRAVVKSAGLRSFGDGTTTLLAQLF